MSCVFAGFISGVLVTAVSGGVAWAYARPGTVAALAKEWWSGSSLVQISRNVYELSYRHNGQRYKLCLPIPRGPKTIVRVAEQGTDDDFTAVVGPYLGPNQDFHQTVVIPEFIRHESLRFHTRFGTQLKLDADRTPPLLKPERNTND